MAQDINRLKVVLAEKKRTNKCQDGYLIVKDSKDSGSFQVATIINKTRLTAITILLKIIIKGSIIQLKIVIIMIDIYLN